MQRLKVFLSMAVMFTLSSCSRYSDFSLKYDLIEFRQTCFGSRTYECLAKRVSINTRLLKRGQKSWEDAKEEAVRKVGLERYDLVDRIFDRRITEQQDDKPWFFMRWFFSDKEVPYEMPRQFLLDESTLNQITAEALRDAKGMPPLPGVTQASSATQPSNVQAALAGPVVVGPVNGPTPGPALSRLFVADAIQARQSWVEAIAGTPARTLKAGDGRVSNTYSVDSCDVTVSYEGDVVVALELELSEKCGVPVKAILPNVDDLRPGPLPFSEVFAANSNDIRLSCAAPGECGNAVDPGVSASLGGSQADGFMEVVYSGKVTGDADTRALLQVVHEIARQTGKEEGSLTADEYNASPLLATEVKAKLKDVQATTLTLRSSM